MRCFASTPFAMGSSNHERSGAPDWGSAELANQLQLSTWNSRYSHSIVKNCLQFVQFCRSLFQFDPFAPSLRKCRESMGSNLGHGFRGGAGHLRGSRRVTKAGERVLKVFWLYSKREAVDRPCICCALSPSRHRPPASARAYRAASILATNSLAHLIASSTSWSTGRPSARAAYISSHP